MWRGKERRPGRDDGIVPETSDHIKGAAGANGPERLLKYPPSVGGASARHAAGPTRRPDLPPVRGDNIPLIFVRRNNDNTCWAAGDVASAGKKRRMEAKQL